MNNLKEYILEKLVINNDAAPEEFDSLMKAVMFARRTANTLKKNYFVYKTKNNKYMAEENIDNYKIGDSFEDNTVVEVINRAE